MIMTSLSNTLLLLIFFQCLSPNDAFAQYTIEILNTTAVNHHRVVKRCDAAGADFGQDIFTFSFEGLYGCATEALPQDACSPVKMPATMNHTMCNTFYAVVPRSNCSFSEKAYNVQRSSPIGYRAIIMYNYEGKVPEAMKGAKYSDLVTIPVVMVDYECMQALLYEFNFRDGHVVNIKITPGYYDLLKYLVPFGAVISFCLMLLLVSLVIRVCRERQRLARKRLSRSNLRKLPLVKYKKNAGMYETCAICLEDFIEDEKLRQLPCRHAYHMKCIDPWLTKNRKVCPICKRKVGPNTGSDSSDSEPERPSMPATRDNAAAAALIATSSTSASFDSVPLLNYEQPIAVSSSQHHHNLHGHLVGNLAVLSNEAAGIPPRTSFEEDAMTRIAMHPQRFNRMLRFINATQSFIRRVTRSNDFNPHTILDNDFTSVSDDDVEGGSSSITAVIPDPQSTTIAMLSATNRDIIIEPLPRHLDVSLHRQPSNDSEVEILIGDLPHTPSHTPPPPR